MKGNIDASLGLAEEIERRLQGVAPADAITALLANLAGIIGSFTPEYREQAITLAGEHIRLLTEAFASGDVRHPDAL